MQTLRERLSRITDLGHAAAILEWDQETYMPAGAAEGRARQIATLRSLAHDILISEETGTLLEQAAPESAIDADLVRVTKKDYDKATRASCQAPFDRPEASASSAIREEGTRVALS